MTRTTIQGERRKPGMNRIEKVTRIIDIIESNLTLKLDLEQIAKQCQKLTVK